MNTVAKNFFNIFWNGKIIIWPKLKAFIGLDAKMLNGGNISPQLKLEMVKTWLQNFPSKNPTAVNKNFEPNFITQFPLIFNLLIFLNQVVKFVSKMKTCHIFSLIIIVVKKILANIYNNAVCVFCKKIIYI